MQRNTCPEKIARNQLSLHLCPNETSNCASGARVRRVIMHRHCLARIVNDLINNAGKAKIEHVVRQRTRCYERSLASSSLDVEIE